MARSLFIYWKVDAEAAAPAITAATQLQRALRAAHPGLAAQLYQRADLRDGLATLMESYTHPQGLSAELQTAIAQAAEPALAAWCRGARHVEVFDALPS